MYSSLGKSMDVLGEAGAMGSPEAAVPGWGIWIFSENGFSTGQQGPLSGSTKETVEPGLSDWFFHLKVINIRQLTQLPWTSASPSIK